MRNEDFLIYVIFWKCRVTKSRTIRIATSILCAWIAVWCCAPFAAGPGAADGERGPLQILAAGLPCPAILAHGAGARIEVSKQRNTRSSGFVLPEPGRRHAHAASLATMAAETAPPRGKLIAVPAGRSPPRPIS